MKKSFSKKSKKLSRQEGFIMLEVLTSILMVTGFVSIALELMVLTVAYKVNLKAQSQAVFWFKEDQSKILALADSLTIGKNTKCRNSPKFALELWKKLEPLSSSTFKSTTSLILDDKGINDDLNPKQLEKVLVAGTQKNYKLQRTYQIQKSFPEILILSYRVVDPVNNKKIAQTELKVRPNAYNSCSA